MQNLVVAIHARVAAHRDAIISFLRDLVAIPSYDSNIRNVAARKVYGLATFPQTVVK